MADYIHIIPSLVTEGCLISVSRRGAGSGGRGIPSCRRCGTKSRRSKPLRPGAPTARRGAPMTAGPATGHRLPAPRLGPQRWIGGPSNSRGKAGRLKREVHRGRGGANLKTPRAGRHGNGGLAALSDFDKPRCREASRSAGPSGPWRPARPRYFSRAAVSIGIRRTRRRSKNTGNDARLFVIPGRERQRANPEFIFRSTGVMDSGFAVYDRARE